jgi:hypothetical protein
LEDRKVEWIILLISDALGGVGWPGRTGEALARIIEALGGR